MAQRKLLLADDSITIQKVINLTFADEGIEVTAVGNGLTAVERLEEVRPDLVLADVHMPGLSGYEVCEQVRRTPGFENTPIMLLVGSFEPFDEAEARRVGANDFLTKPFQSIKQLVSKVHSLLGSTENGTKTENTAPQRTTNAETAFAFLDDKTAAADSMPLKESGSSFRDSGFDDEMIETNSYNPNFAETFRDYRLTEEPENKFTSDNKWQVVEQGDKIDFEKTAESFNEAPTGNLNINETNPLFETKDDQFEFDNATDFQFVERRDETGDAIDNLLEVETTDRVTEPEPFSETPELNLNSHSEEFIDVEPEISLPEPEPPPQEEQNPPKLRSPFADLFEDEDLLGIEDEIKAEISEQNFQSSQVESETQTEASEAITPEIVSATENQSQEIATINPANQSTAVEKAGEYTALNFPPEVIDAIAARVVERLSDKVIEKIAWEIVPDRFDLIVRKTIPNKDRER